MQQLNMETDFIVIGSGAGGATVARELALRKKQVIIIERGGWPVPMRKPGSDRSMEVAASVPLWKTIHSKMRRRLNPARKTHIHRRVAVGGTTTKAHANMVPCLEAEFDEKGVDLDNDFRELERELKIAPFNPAFMQEGARRILEAGLSEGIHFDRMPKCIDFNKCSACYLCTDVCPKDAKWTAINFMREAEYHGARIFADFEVQRIVVSDGRACGVTGIYQSRPAIIRSKVVVLAAGALATPFLLQSAGVSSVGRELFCDPSFVVCGPVEGRDFIGDVSASLYCADRVQVEGFSLMNCLMAEPTSYTTAMVGSGKTMLGVMIKVKDDMKGRVIADGVYHKFLTSNDVKKLEAGSALAEKILRAAGVKPHALQRINIGAYHPGGTAAMFKVVDRDQESSIRNLFVADASVLPAAPGLPPMLTIMALSRRLARNVAQLI